MPKQRKKNWTMGPEVLASGPTLCFETGIFFFSHSGCTQLCLKEVHHRPSVTMDLVLTWLGLLQAAISHQCGNLPGANWQEA